MRFVSDVIMYLLSPNDGESVSVGNDLNVKIQTINANFGTHAKLEFTDDGGVSWVTVLENQELFNLGEFGVRELSFNIGYGSPSNRCRVRVSSVSNPAYSVTSDFFTVVAE
jgi:hypothetical protein